MRDEGVGTRDHVHGREGKGQQMKKKKERTHQVAVASRDEGEATREEGAMRCDTTRGKGGRGMRRVAKGDATRGKGDATRGKGRGKGGRDVT